jgi:hypothetical protein
LTRVGWNGGLGCKSNVATAVNFYHRQNAFQLSQLEKVIKFVMLAKTNTNLIRILWLDMVFINMKPNVPIKRRGGQP